MVPGQLSTRFLRCGKMDSLVKFGAGKGKKRQARKTRQDPKQAPGAEL